METKEKKKRYTNPETKIITIEEKEILTDIISGGKDSSNALPRFGTNGILEE